VDGRPIRIWRVLGVVDWWWVLLVGALEVWAHVALRIPGWIPSLSILWVFVQASWLKQAEPGSKSIYFYLMATAAQLIGSIHPIGGLSQLLLTVVSLISSITWIVGIFVFRDEMRRHFTQVDPRGLELSGVMTFFFSTLYFQYWLRQIYKEQTEPNLSLTAAQS